MAFAQEQRDRIDLVSSHWFFGNTALQPQLWLRGGVEGKKKRAEAKLGRAEGEHPALVQAIRASEAALPALQEKLNGCRSAHARRTQIERELTTMRDGSAASDARLHAIQFGLRRCAIVRDLEQNLRRRRRYRVVRETAVLRRAPLSLALRALSLLPALRIRNA